MTDNDQERNVNVTRVFDAPIEEAWKAWSDSAYVRQWWGPTGFTCPLAEMDFREGGTSLVCMRAPMEFGGQDLFNTWTYQKIVPMQRIEYILRFTDKEGKAFDPAEMGLPAGIPKEVRNVNIFTDLAAAKLKSRSQNMDILRNRHTTHLKLASKSASTKWLGSSPANVPGTGRGIGCR